MFRSTSETVAGSQIDAALSAVERWLTSAGIEATKVTLDDQTYVLERRAALSTVSVERVEQLATNHVRSSSSRCFAGRVAADCAQMNVPGELRRIRSEIE